MTVNTEPTYDFKLTKEELVALYRHWYFERH
jgi:hypothetical protein